MKAPRISKDANGIRDLVFENGRFKTVTEGAEAAQHMETRLNIISKYQDTPGELTLNGEIGDETLSQDGTDLYGILLDASKSKAEKDLHLKRRILQTPGIKKILTWSWTQTGSAVSISSLILTDWGEWDLSGTYELL
jgi:hypothetical protein